MPAIRLPEDQRPSVSVYSVPSEASAKTKLRELSDSAQAALVYSFAEPGLDKDALRKALATPLEGAAPEPGVDDRTSLDRIVVVSVRKGLNAQPGDRLMRTVVTIRPHPDASHAGGRFEFSGYSITATDTRVQSIAHIEDQTDRSLEVALSPKLGPLGSGGVTGHVGHTTTSSADVAQAYENLNTDIAPDRIIISRESERGLDLAGNTFVALTLAGLSPSGQAGVGQPQDFLASSVKIYDKAKPLAWSAAELDVKPISVLNKCPFLADVELDYIVRHIQGGADSYVEGKQTVSLVRDHAGPFTQILVRAEDVQSPLFQLVVTRRGKVQGAVQAQTVDGANKRLLFEDFDAARAMAHWLRPGGAMRFKASGIVLTMGSRPIPADGEFQARPYQLKCDLPPAQ